MCSQDLNSESDCFPHLPLFYMDSETMGGIEMFAACYWLVVTDCESIEVHIG